MAPKYTVEGVIADYRVVKTVNMAVRAITQSGGDGESDFNHVVASYLAFGFMAIRASDGYRKTILPTATMSDRLTSIRLCRGLFSAGLLDRLTPEGRIQLSSYWLEALAELNDVKPPQDCLTQFLREYGLDKRDFIEEPKHKGKVGVERGPELAQEIAEYGMYVPKHIAEQLTRRADNTNLTLAVKRFVTRGYGINQKGPSTAPKLVLPGKVGAESSKPVDAALAFAQLKKDLAEEKKRLDLEIATKAKVTSEKSTSADGGVLELVTAVSVIEQIESCDTLAACYRASRTLPPDEDLSKVSDDKMLAYVTSIASNLLADIAGSKKIERPAIIQVAPWKKIGDLQLTETHKTMVQARLTEYLDDRIIDAFVAIVEQRRANVLRRDDIPVGNLIATQRWAPTPDLRGVRGGGGTRVEIQVLNQGGNHWVVAVRFPGENPNAAYVYDPLQPAAISALTQAQVRRCFSMADEHPVTRLAGPRQPLNYECGAYVCAAVEVLSRAGATPAELRTALQQAAFVNNTIRANLYQSIEANNLAGF